MDVITRTIVWTDRAQNRANPSKTRSELCYSVQLAGAGGCTQRRGAVRT